MHSADNLALINNSVWTAIGYYVAVSRDFVHTYREIVCVCIARNGHRFSRRDSPLPIKHCSVFFSHNVMVVIFCSG